MITKYLKQVFIITLIFSSFGKSYGAENKAVLEVVEGITGFYDLLLELESILTSLEDLRPEIRQRNPRILRGLQNLNVVSNMILNSIEELEKINQKLKTLSPKGASYLPIFLNIKNRDNALKLGIYAKNLNLIKLVSCISKEKNYKFQDGKTAIKYAIELGEEYRGIANFLKNHAIKLSSICQNNITKKINKALAKRITVDQPILIPVISDIVSQYAGFPEDTIDLYKLSNDEIDEIIRLNNNLFGIELEEEKEKAEDVGYIRTLFESD